MRTECCTFQWEARVTKRHPSSCPSVRKSRIDSPEISSGDPRIRILIFENFKILHEKTQCALKDFAFRSGDFFCWKFSLQKKNCQISRRQQIFLWLKRPIFPALPKSEPVAPKKCCGFGPVSKKPARSSQFRRRRKRKRTLQTFKNRFRRISKKRYNYVAEVGYFLSFLQLPKFDGFGNSLHDRGGGVAH